MRYPLASGGSSSDGLIKMWAYEACRLFRDKLVGDNAKEEFDAILGTVIRSVWSVAPPESDVSYVTWGSVRAKDSISSQFGSPLGQLSIIDMRELVQKAITSYSKCVYR